MGEKSRHSFAYPGSRPEASPHVDLAARETRERLSSGALRAFFNLMRAWRVRDDDARVLLGGVSSSAFYRLKKAPDKLLDADCLTRISYLVGIYKALHILHGAELADTWVSLPNHNALFAGRRPLDVLLRGGIMALHRVRALLDARRGGL